ncbi:MAG: hypothetical protein M1536_07605 [Firmicutes bacterium]|nr:hypothetical protein [Bacillota bacterium]
MKDKNAWLWFAAGVGTIVTTAVFVQFYYKKCKTSDPRGKRVKELIHEAEKLLAAGRRSAHKKSSPQEN